MQWKHRVLTTGPPDNLSPFLGQTLKRLRFFSKYDGTVKNSNHTSFCFQKNYLNSSIFFVSILMEWGWRWSSNTLITWHEELAQWKRHCCWERLEVGGEGDNRRWDGWMTSPTQWTWVSAISGRWWRTEEPGMLQSMGSQRVRHDWVTELNWTEGFSTLALLTFSDWTTTMEWRRQIWNMFPFCPGSSFPISKIPFLFLYMVWVCVWGRNRQTKRETKWQGGDLVFEKTENLKNVLIPGARLK